METKNRDKREWLLDLDLPERQNVPPDVYMLKLYIYCIKDDEISVFTTCVQCSEYVKKTLLQASWHKTEMS